MCVCAHMYSSSSILSRFLLGFVKVKHAFAFWSRFYFGSFDQRETKLLDVQKREIVPFFFFYCSCFIYKHFIPFQTECHKNINILSIFFSSLLLRYENYQSSQWLSGWVISHTFHYVSYCRDAKNLYVIWTLFKGCPWQRFAKIFYILKYDRETGKHLTSECAGQGRDGFVNRS